MDKKTDEPVMRWSKNLGEALIESVSINAGGIFVENLHRCKKNKKLHDADDCERNNLLEEFYKFANDILKEPKEQK